MPAIWLNIESLQYIYEVGVSSLIYRWEMVNQSSHVAKKLYNQESNFSPNFKSVPLLLNV